MALKKPKFHLIAGLPRSGSTLLAAILRQNPRFHAAMSSPVGAMFNVMLGPMSATSEHAVFFTEEKKQTLLRNVFDVYYQDQSDKEVIFDTNRLWCTKLPAICQMLPGSKVICCVRNVAWIMDSFERLIRRNAFTNSRLFNSDSERNTVYSRIETMALGDRVVGFAYNAVKEVFYGEHAELLLVVDYDIMVSAPRQTLELIYEFIGEEPFAHNFESVEYESDEFDEWLGLKGLHRVSGRVEPRPRATILPPDLFEKFNHLSFWQNAAGSKAHVIRVSNGKAREI